MPKSFTLLQNLIQSKYSNFLISIPYSPLHPQPPPRLLNLHPNLQNPTTPTTPAPSSFQTPHINPSSSAIQTQCNHHFYQIKSRLPVFIKSYRNLFCWVLVQLMFESIRKYKLNMNYDGFLNFVEIKRWRRKRKGNAGGLGLLRWWEFRWEKRDFWRKGLVVGMGFLEVLLCGGKCLRIWFWEIKGNSEVELFENGQIMHKDNAQQRDLVGRL